MAQWAPPLKRGSLLKTAAPSLPRIVLFMLAGLIPALVIGSARIPLSAFSSAQRLDRDLTHAVSL